MSVTTRKMRLATVLGSALPLILIAACGSSSESSGESTGLTGTVELSTISDLTGRAGFGGKANKLGQDIALEEINSSGFLGDAKLKLVVEDTASETQQAAILANKAIRSKTPLLLGPLLSPVCQVVAPLVQSKKLPTIFTQGGADGINVGEYTYRATMPGKELIPKLGPFLSDKGIKTISLIHDTDSDAGPLYANETIPAFAEKYDMKIVSKKGVLSSVNDFTSIASGITKDNPDAVGVILVGAQNVTVIKQLRQAGYKGQIFAQAGAGGGTLTPLGALGDGVVWASDYHAESVDPGNKKFLELWSAKYPDQQPINLNAEGYDQVWLAARALKEANSTDREKVAAALKKVTDAGFDGAVGKVTFEDRDEQVAGVIIEWKGGKETLAQ